MESSVLLLKLNTIMKDLCGLYGGLIYKKDLKSIMGMMLYNRIIENLSGCLIILREGLNTPFYPMIRSAYEASVNLNNLKKHKNYYYILEHDYYENQRSKLEFVKQNPDIDFVKEIFSDYEETDIDEKINKAKCEKQKIVNRIENSVDKSLIKKMNNIRGKIENSEYGKDGYFAYKYLCDGAHNNLTSLNQTSFDDELHLIVNKKIDKIDMGIIIDLLSTIMFYSLIDIYDYIENIDDIDYCSIRRNILTFRTEYKKIYLE